MRSPYCINGKYTAGNSCLIKCVICEYKLFSKIKSIVKGSCKKGTVYFIFIDKGTGKTEKIHFKFIVRGILDLIMVAALSMLMMNVMITGMYMKRLLSSKKPTKKMLCHKIRRSRRHPRIQIITWVIKRKIT